MDVKMIVCFRRVGSPNKVVVVKSEHSSLFLAIFQPEEANYGHRVGDSKVIEREADLTPPSSSGFVRRNRIIAGRNLFRHRNTLLLQSPSVPVLNYTATTLARSALPTFVISDVQSSPLARQLPLLQRRESTRGSE